MSPPKRCWRRVFPRETEQGGEDARCSFSRESNYELNGLTESTCDEFPGSRLSERGVLTSASQVRQARKYANNMKRNSISRRDDLRAW